MEKFKKSNLETKNSVEEIVENLNDILKNTPGLRDIFEYVYFYEKLPNDGFYNRTVFSFIGISKEDLKNYSKEKILEIGQQKIKNLISKLEEYKNILKLPTEISTKEDFKKLVLYNALTFYINSLKLVYYGLLFEIEKTNYFGKFEDKLRKIYLKQLENLEEKIYGPKVIDNEEELLQIYNFLNNLLENSKTENKLTNEEEKVITTLLSKIEDKLRKINSQLKKEGDTKFQQKGKNEKIHELKNTIISTEELKIIFKKVFQIYGINKPIKIDPNASNIYNANNCLYIPKDKNYSILQALKLIAHEIETHYLTLNNQEEITGDLKDNYNIKEESLATVFQEYSISNELPKFSKNLPLILASETLSLKELKIFLQAYKKLTGRNFDLRKRLIRLKRNYPLVPLGAQDKDNKDNKDTTYSSSKIHENAQMLGAQHKDTTYSSSKIHENAQMLGAQHKDTTYSRGIEKILERIKNKKDRKILFSGQRSFETLNKGYSFLEEYSKNSLLPLLIAEIIKLKLMGEKITKQRILKLLEEKYPFVNKTWAQKRIENITYQQKRKIVEILRLLRTIKKEQKKN